MRKTICKNLLSVCVPVVQDACASAFQSYLGVAKGIWRNLLPIIRHPCQMIWCHVTNVDRIMYVPMLIAQDTVVSHAGHYV